MHEDLLGYLLGALEPHEMRRIAQLLRDDADARAELAKIQNALRPLEEGYQGPTAPSSDLVRRTLDSLPPLPAETDAPVPTPVLLTPMGSVAESSDRGSMNWLDWVSGSMALAILLGLLLPAIAQGRFESRKAACQDRFRQLHTALVSYVTRNPHEQLPAVAEQGPEAFAGVYAVRLHDAGLLDDPSVRWCPSRNPPSFDSSTPQENQLVGFNELVSVADLHQSPVNRLQQLQRIVGGHYAYNLGVIERDRLTAPKFESRATFAVMADAPLPGFSNGRLGVENVGHSGKGINVLFEDGRVQFFTLEALEAMPDHPLWNHRRRNEAGINVDDASLAPSWRPPFVDVKQR
ncbi:MAG: hypothetical protein HKN47_23325 [Pirellulaceae bacterium]|nr:hypothetical protein [Pirellulaceae bacterium]